MKLVGDELKIVEVAKIINNYDHTDGGWFWTKYGAGPYVGCSYDCVYCYNVGFEDSQIQIKQDAIKRFREELSALPKDVVTIGDYQPVDIEKRLIREMIKVVLDLDFPLHIVDKSPLVVSDLDLIKSIGDKSWAAVSMSVTAAPTLPELEKNLQKFEPGTATARERFDAMAKIAEAGILTGTCCVPFIPFIGDSLENIEEMIKSTKEAGGQYFILGALVIPAPLDQNFWNVVESDFPDIQAELRDLYSQEKNDEFDIYFGDLDRETTKLCNKYGISTSIPRPVDFYPEKTRRNKQLAESYYLDVRASKANKLSSDWEYSNLAIANLLDDLDTDLVAEFEAKGLKALTALGLEKKTSEEMAKRIKSLTKKG